MLSKLTTPVTIHVRNALKQHTQQQAQKAGQKRRTRENFERDRDKQVFGAPEDYVYESPKRLRSACSMALLACPDDEEEFWSKVYEQDPVTMRDIRRKLKIEYHMKQPEHLLSGVFNPKVQPGMRSIEEYHTCSCHQNNLKEAYIVTHQETGECILLGSKCIELMSDVPNEAKVKFKEHKREIARKQRLALRKKELPSQAQIWLVMVCRAAMTEEQLKQSGMHGHGFYDSKWNKDSISKWLDTWYNRRPRPPKEIWNRFPREKQSEMLNDWINCIDKSDYRTPSTPMAGFRKASSLQSKAKRASVIPPREPGFQSTPNTSASKRRSFRYSGRLRGREAKGLPYPPADRVYSEADFREIIMWEDIQEPWRFVQKHGGRMKEGNGGWECVGLHSYHSVGDKWLSSDFMKAGIFIGRQKPDEAEVLRALKRKFASHTDAEYANGVRQCLKLYDIHMQCSRPAPQKRVRELLVTQPQAPAPAPKKAKVAERKPMQWNNVNGGHNGQFFEWDSRRKMVLSFHLELNDGDSWDDIVWWAYPDGTRRTLVIQPAYSFRTAYGAYGTTGHYLIIKPDQDEWTRRQLYSAIERAFVEDKESDGTANPKPRLCLSRYNHHPFLEGLSSSGRFFEVDGKNIPVLECRWGS